MLNDVPYAQSILGLLPPCTVRIAVLHNPLPSMLRTALSNASECDGVVTVSPGLHDLLVEGFRADPSRVVAICNGVDVPRAWPKADNGTVGRRPIRIAFVGRIEHRQKGVLLLPEILQRTAERSVPIQLTVVGDGPDSEELQTRMVSTCPTVNSVFPGSLRHDETLRRLAEQDILIMPSFYEGLPIVLLEAMSLGVVPVVSRLQGRTDVVVQNRESGYLVEPGDVNGFSDAISELAADRAKLRAMSSKAWQKVRSEFTIDEVGAAYLSLFESVRRDSGRRTETASREGIDLSLLGDLPHVPVALVRPIRKLLRMLGVWKLLSRSEPLAIPDDVSLREDGTVELKSHVTQSLYVNER